ncbi:SurA N-terminal domain-containing protein [Gemmatimonadota bacterium]
MMQTFRNNMKIIFYVLIFFFVGWMAFTLTGLDDYFTQQSRQDLQGMKYAGEIAGRKIDRALYEQRVQSTVNLASSQRPGGNLSAWEIDQIADQVWNEIVNEMVLGDAYDRRSINVYNNEIVEYIRGNPIQELRESPQLQTDGQFDFDKYLGLLANPAAANLVLELESDARQKIPSLKLFLEVASLGKLTDTEVERAYRTVQEKVNVAFVAFNPEMMVGDDEVEVSEQQIADYYEENTDTFQRPETASFQYLLMPMIPSAEDTAATLDTLKAITDRLAAGEEWDSLAMRYSMGPLASSGGDLGWFSKGDYNDEQMVDLALSLNPGQTSLPALTASGFQIIRTDSVKFKGSKREVKARRILLEIVPGRKTSRDVRARARNLRKVMSQGEKMFVRVATDSGFVVMETGEFAVGSQIPGLQVTRELINFLYGAKEDQLSYPLSAVRQGSDNEEAIMLANILSRKDKGQIPLSEASPAIRRRLMIDAKKEIARGMIELQLTGYDSYPDLAAFAEDKELPIDTSGLFSRASGLTGMGRNNEFIGTAFGLPINAKSPLIETDNMYYLLEPIQHDEADMSQLEQNRERLVGQLIATRMQAFFALYSTEIMAKMDVKDFRRVSSPPDSSGEQTMSGGAQN